MTVNQVQQQMLTTQYLSLKTPNSWADIAIKPEHAATAWVKTKDMKKSWVGQYLQPTPAMMQTSSTKLACSSSDAADVA